MVSILAPAIETAHSSKAFFVELAMCRDLVVAGPSAIGVKGQWLAALGRAARSMPESERELSDYVGRSGIDLAAALEVALPL